MIDIHNHLLYGIDDGSKSVEESVSILKEMEKCGYTDIILTPHYINGTRYSSSRNNNLERLAILQNELNKKNISINLYLGNEIYIDEDIDNLVKDGLISPLNNTNTLLIELPMSGEYPGYIEIFRDLIDKGYKIILAHPERYLTIQDDYDLIYEILDLGIKLQSNIDSLIGKYGEGAKETLKKLLKEKKVSYLATDIHHQKHDYDVWKTAKKIALKYISENEFIELTKINPSQIID